MSKLFPNAHLTIGTCTINAHILFAILTTLIVMPTTWLRDLSCLSFISGINTCHRNPLFHQIYLQNLNLLNITHTQVLFQKKIVGQGYAAGICYFEYMLGDTHQTDVQVWCLRIHIIGKKKGCTMCLGSHLVHSVIAGGVIASIVIVACLFWVGLVDHIEAKDEGTALNLPGIPIAVGLYGYCYSGHGVFPNIYSSMKKRSQFPAVIFTW